MSSRDELPVVCSLEQEALSGRKSAWRDLTRGALLGTEETETGVRLRFAGSPEAGSELRRLAELEAVCCAFAKWSVREDSEGLVLVLSSTGDGVAAARAMVEGLSARE